MTYRSNSLTRLALRVLLLILILFVSRLAARAQGVGVGISTPDASAVLDVAASNRGLLVPRVALSTATAAAPLTLPATSLLVYNTNAAMSGGLGFYYNAGTPAAPQWVQLVITASPAGGDHWRTGGNGGTTAGTQFIGTTDAQDLVFKTNGTERLRLKQSGALWPSMAQNVTALGYEAGLNLTTASNSTFLGFRAGLLMSTGADNTFVGSGSGLLTTASDRYLSGGFSVAGKPPAAGPAMLSWAWPPAPAPTPRGPTTPSSDGMPAIAIRTGHQQHRPGR